MLTNNLNDNSSSSGREAQQLPSETRDGWIAHPVKGNTSLARTLTPTPSPGWVDLKAAVSPYLDSADYSGDIISSSLCSLLELDDNDVEETQQEMPHPNTYTTLPTSITLALSAASSYHSHIHSNSHSNPQGLSTTMSMSSNLAFPSVSTLSCVSSSSNSNNSLHDSNCDTWDALPQQQHRHHLEDCVSMDSLDGLGVVAKDNMGRRRESIMDEKDEKEDEHERRERENTNNNTMHDVRSEQAQKQQHQQQQQTQGEHRTFDNIGHAGYTQQVCAGTTLIHLDTAEEDEGDEDEDEEEEEEDGDFGLCDQTHHEGAQEKEVIGVDHSDDGDQKNKNQKQNVNKVKEGESEVCWLDEGAGHAQGRGHDQRNERYRWRSEHAHEHEHEQIEQLDDMPMNGQHLHGHHILLDNTGKTLSSRSPSPTDSILTSTPPSPASSPASTSPSSPYASSPFSSSSPHHAPIFTSLGASTLPIVSVNLQHTPSPVFSSLLSAPTTLTTEPVASPLSSSSLPLSATLSAPNDPSQRFEVLERLGFGSSGSSIFKAVDRKDNNKIVAIKKIPLSVMTDGPENETTSDDVDYFVSWIADHCCAETKAEDGCASPTEASSSPVVPGYPRRRSSISTDSKGLDQIVQCLGCHRDDDELWLSLEYCGGGSVADLIRLSDGPLSEGEIGWIMSQILLGLAYLHGKGHVHGDIKAGNILMTAHGHVKLGGSGSIMDHKEGAGERKRRRRSLTMAEFPASWLAPESTPTTPTSPSSLYSPVSPLVDHSGSHTMPEASTETDIWALGVACIELSQGRTPRPETPIFVSFGEQRMTSTLSLSPRASSNSASTSGRDPWSYFGGGQGGMMMMGLSEELWMFIGRCLTPEPEARPTVHELIQDPFIVMHSDLSQALLNRIKRMMEFVDQCAVISSDGLLQDASLTLSPSKATQLFDQQVEEERVGPWLIPMVRPRVDSVYDESSYFDQAGLPMTPPDQRADPDVARLLSDWKHQRISHPVVKQALMRDRAGYITFRHSRSPSLATIPENQLLEDQVYVAPESTDTGEENEAEEIEEEFEDQILVELELGSKVACDLARQTSQECLRTKTEAVIQPKSIQPGFIQPHQSLDEVIQTLEVQDNDSVDEKEQEGQVLIDCNFEESDTDCDTGGVASISQFQTTSGSMLSSSMPQSICRRSLTQFSGPPPPPSLAMSSVRAPPSSIPAFIRPRTISTTSTATNSSISTVKPNKSLERMLMMMRRTDKTATSDLQQHTEYLGDEDEEDEEGHEVYCEGARRDIASEDDKEEAEEQEIDDDDRSIIHQPYPRETRLLRRHNASTDQLERSPLAPGAQGRRFSLQYDLRGMLRGRRSSRDSSCENLYPEEGVGSSSRRFSLASISSSVGEGGSRGARKSATLPTGGGSGGGGKVKGVLKWIREWPPRLKRRVSVSGMKDSG